MLGFPVLLEATTTKLATLVSRTVGQNARVQFFQVWMVRYSAQMVHRFGATIVGLVLILTSAKIRVDARDSGECEGFSKATEVVTGLDSQRLCWRHVHRFRESR